jgi:hypothetical protein
MKYLLFTLLVITAPLAWADHDRRSGDRYGHERYDHGRLMDWQLVYRWLQEDRRHQRYDSRHRWERVQKIRTRSRHSTMPVIQVNRKVDAVSLRGLKRRAHVQRAWIEFGNGRIMPIDDLEGYLDRGESLTREFRRPRFVKQIVLRLAPEHHRRAYLSVDVKPVDESRHRGRRFDERFRDNQDHAPHKKGKKRALS